MKDNFSNLDYSSFRQRMLAELTGFFPAGTRLSIDSFSCNNRRPAEGLAILEPGSNISPTIYLEGYFKQYEDGASFEDVRGQILQYYSHHRHPQSIDASFFTCLGRARPQIAYKLIHYDKNRELLREIPHFAYLDLAIVFYYLIPGQPEQNASILIRNSHLSYWNISKDTLLLFAQQNTPQLLPYSLSSLPDLFSATLCLLPEDRRQEALQELENSPLAMYVLTNSRCYLGACCILYPDALKEISEELGGSLILLPSSIHEFILIPASFGERQNTLREIVREVNMTSVAPEEILSDSVYYYDCQTDQVSLL